MRYGSGASDELSNQARIQTVIFLGKGDAIEFFPCFLFFYCEFGILEERISNLQFSSLSRGLAPATRCNHRTYYWKRVTHDRACYLKYLLHTFFPTGPEWRRQRRLLEPLFSNNLKIKFFIPGVLKKCETLCNDLRRCDGQDIDVLFLMRDLSLKLACGNEICLQITTAQA